MKKVLAIASGGGHWKQLMMLTPSFANCEVHYITTLDGLPQQNNITNFSIVRDSNKNKPLDTIRCALQVVKCFIKFRPDVVISTGAAPGVLGLIIAYSCRTKTIWVDSIANSRELSLCGKVSRMFAANVLTQWPELADDKVKYVGAVF